MVHICKNGCPEFVGVRVALAYVHAVDKVVYKTKFGFVEGTHGEWKKL